MLVLGGDFSGHVGDHSAGFEGVYGGSRYDMTNQDRLHIFDLDLSLYYSYGSPIL